MEYFENKGHTIVLYQCHKRTSTKEEIKGLSSEIKDCWQPYLISFVLIGRHSTVHFLCYFAHSPTVGYFPSGLHEPAQTFFWVTLHFSWFCTFSNCWLPSLWVTWTKPA